MPTYVYECSKCKDIFEVEQRITENALDKCHCGSVGTVKRLIQPTAVMFKGAGFHINDYSGAAKPESKEKPEDAPIPPPKSETKAPEVAAAKTSDTTTPATPAGEATKSD
jgi:putative FmdB family regulatory protein